MSFLPLSIGYLSTKKINIPCVFKYQFDGLYYEVNSKEPFSGCQFTFTEDMIPTDEVNYREGKLHGAHKQFSSAGVLVEEWNFKEGKLHGIHNSYTSGGLLLNSDLYVNGIFGDTFYDNTSSHKNS